MLENIGNIKPNQFIPNSRGEIEVNHNMLLNDYQTSYYDGEIDINTVISDFRKDKIEITKDGIRISGALGEEHVKIAGDDVEESIEHSIYEGMLKGMLVKAFGAAYPLIFTVARAVWGYLDGTKAAEKAGLSPKNSEEVGKILAFQNAARTLPHALLDVAGITALTAAWGAIAGTPVGIASTVLMGAFYNVLKDAIRKLYRKIKEDFPGYD